MRVEALVRKFFGVKSTWCKNGLVKKHCDKLFGVRAFSVKTVHAKEQLVYIKAVLCQRFLLCFWFDRYAVQNCLVLQMLGEKGIWCKTIW